MYPVTTTTSHALQSDAAISLLNILPIGIILLNDRGYVLHINGLAEHILSCKDGLYIHSNLLCAARSSENYRLRQVISDTPKQSSYSGITRQPLLLITRSHGRRALEIIVWHFPYKVQALPNQKPTKVAILIRDPERQLPKCQDWLKTLYGLTPAEASIAERIAQSISVGELAREQNVQPNTIRIHLKHIYRKTRTNGQNELVNLLTSNYLLHIPLTAFDNSALCT